MEKKSLSIFCNFKTTETQTKKNISMKLVTKSKMSLKKKENNDRNILSRNKNKKINETKYETNKIRTIDWNGKNQVEITGVD